MASRSIMFWTLIIVLNTKPISCNAKVFQNNEMPAKWMKPEKMWNWKHEKTLQHPAKDETAVLWESGEHKPKRNRFHEETASSRQSLFGPEVTDGASFKEAVLQTHNEYRQMHHSPHLHLDKELSNAAQEYAKELSLLGVSQLKHSQGYNRRKYGENIFVVCEKNVFPIDPVKDWYLEVCEYDFLTHKARKSGKIVKNFTQVVWRGTRKLGVGRAIAHYNDKPCTYIVTHYLPPKNQGEAQQRNNVDIGDFNKEICKDSHYAGFGAVG